MKSLIFVSLENWDDLWRRNQFVCAELARRHPGATILFVGLSRRLRAGKPAFGGPPCPVPGFPNILLTAVTQFLPARFGWGRRVNAWLTRWQLRRTVRALRLPQPLLWINAHQEAHLAGTLDEAALIYDVTDDWELMTQSDADRQRVRAQDAALGRAADAVIVCSERLQRDKEKKFGRPVHLIPNGVEADHYARVLDGRGPLPPVAHAWSQPVLGYTGTLHGDRLDVELIALVARALPEASVVLIGPNFLTVAEQAQLTAPGNVRLLPPVPYAEIPEWMRAFDVCIVPHRVTAFTESLNPIKLWEYLAAGKPVVATPVAGFRDYGRLVRLAEGGAAFAAAVGEALQEPAGLADERRAVAREHAWSARTDRVEAVLREAVEAHDGHG